MLRALGINFKRKPLIRGCPKNGAENPKDPKLTPQSLRYKRKSEISEEIVDRIIDQLN